MLKSQAPAFLDVHRTMPYHPNHLNRRALCSQVLRAHILPLTNCAFNKSGDRFITGSYDRTCKVGHYDADDQLAAYAAQSMQHTRN